MKRNFFKRNSPFYRQFESLFYFFNIVILIIRVNFFKKNLSLTIDFDLSLIRFLKK